MFHRIEQKYRFFFFSKQKYIALPKHLSSYLRHCSIKMRKIERKKRKIKPNQMREQTHEANIRREKKNRHRFLCHDIQWMNVMHKTYMQTSVCCRIEIQMRERCEEGVSQKEWRKCLSIREWQIDFEIISTSSLSFQALWNGIIVILSTAACNFIYIYVIFYINLYDLGCMFTVQLPGMLYSLDSHANCQIMIAQVNVMLHTHTYTTMFKMKSQRFTAQTNKQTNKHVSWWFEFKEKKLNLYVFTMVYQKKIQKRGMRINAHAWLILTE